MHAKDKKLFRLRLEFESRVLRDNDHIAAGGQKGTLELDGRKVIPIRDDEDIVRNDNHHRQPQLAHDPRK